MNLSQLLSGLEVQTTLHADPVITDVVCDSRKVTPGCLFVALSGARADGHRFAAAALRDGAAAVLLERPVADLPPEALAIQTPDTRKALALVSAAFFGHPADRLTLIGITGTKGKTTTAHILKVILEAAGHKTAMVGTVGYFLGKEKAADALNTTPESLDLHRFFAQALAAGCTHLVMEVSSQALKLDRTYGIVYDAALFLNLSPDHIGGAEHKDFAEYLACKARLFTQCRQAVASADDPHTAEILARCTAPVTTFGFSEGAQIRGGTVTPLRGAGLLGSQFSVTGYTKPVQFNMPGVFNASDALAAIAAARVLGVDEAAVRQGLLSTTVRGRT